jgi:prepilin-type N-terminal cleavage/methylation domain-containing protein
LIAPRKARGWSLVELVVVILVLGMLAAFIGPLLVSTFSAYDMTSGTVSAYAKMRYAMERMEREIRDIRRSPADTTKFDINAATLSATNFDFVKWDATAVKIDLNGTNVRVTYGATPGTLADQASLLEMKYYRHDGTTETAAANNIEFVQIRMTLTDKANSYTSRVRVSLRTPQ